MFQPSVQIHQFSSVPLMVCSARSAGSYCRPTSGLHPAANNRREPGQYSLEICVCLFVFNRDSTCDWAVGTVEKIYCHPVRSRDGTDLPGSAGYIYPFSLVSFPAIEVYPQKCIKEKKNFNFASLRVLVAE